MNNSQIVQDALSSLNGFDTVDNNRAEELRKRETSLVELISALEHIRASNYWKVIQEEFVSEIQGLVSQLKKTSDTTEIFRLQGQIVRAEKLDLDKTTESYRQELNGIRKQLQNYA